jgi:hypothetical protein
MPSELMDYLKKYVEHPNMGILSSMELNRIAADEDGREL